MNNTASNIMIHPGGFYFSGRGEILHTLLGSCISITLWHPRQRIGGMCHFILPENPNNSKDDNSLDCRYADDVIKRFRSEILQRGTMMRDYEAKIFGGGNMMRTADQNTENSIGTRNSAAAMQLLMQEKVKILVVQVGEFGHRRIKFDTRSGEVWVRFIGAGKARPNGMGGIL